MSSDERPLRLLSLDGGGIRGLSMIYILQDIMRRVNLGRSKEKHLEPWQYFDMIGGTSTGGIIAIMLGCLKMSLEDCESAYIDLSKEIFTPRRSNYRFIERGVDFVNAAGKFDAGVLENAIKKIIERHSTSSEVELLSHAEPECKVFVCAIHSTDFDSGSITLRSYKNDSEADLFSKKFKLWQACRATSAASTFFDPLELQDGSSFIDGGLKHNNPVKVVFKEAQDVWGLECPLFLISVGTGDAPSGQFHGSLQKVAEGLAKIATDTEQAAEEFYNNWRSLPQLAGYCRLNVPSLGIIGLAEYELGNAIQGTTQKYLKTGETKTKLEQFVKELAETEDKERTGLLSNKDVETIKEFTRNLYQRSSNYNDDKSRVPVHSENTCEWFLDHQKFVQWRQSTETSALWVTADAGCGKSVLAKFLIDRLLSDNHIVIHFFFQHFRHDKNVMLCALLHQLLMFVIPSAEAKSCTMLLTLRHELEYKKGERIMQEDETLWNIICNAATASKCTPSKLFCVIDGLDECQEPSRSQFIKLVVSAFSSFGTARQPHQPPNFLITSRPYPALEECFRPLARIRLRLENETLAISEDIETMITDRIRNLNPTRFPPKLQEHLHAEVSRRAGRTFLWVKLIFDALEQLDSTTKPEIQKRLDTNPNELETLYETSLSTTPNRGRTRRLLQILLVATRPLQLDEVNVALQIRESCVRVEDIDLEPDIEDVIKRLCGSVLRIIDSKVDFMHQTAKEFLIASQPTQEPSQNHTWGASINVPQAHCVLGSICLWHLALKDWDQLSQVLQWHDATFRPSVFPLTRSSERSTYYGVHFRKMIEDGSLIQPTTYTRKEMKKNFADFRAKHKETIGFHEYAKENWPHHVEEVLHRIRRAHETGFEPDPDFVRLEALLTSLRESEMSRIRLWTSIFNDPFLFLTEKGFHSVVHWFLNGPRIKGYPEYHILNVICDALGAEKGAYVWPLLHYATTILRDSERYSIEEKDQMFSHLATAAAEAGLVPVVEYLQQKAKITLGCLSTDVRGLQNAAKSSDYYSMTKLIEWGAKDLWAQSVLASLGPLYDTVFESLRHSSRNHRIRVLLFQTQDYDIYSTQFTCIYPKMFSQYRFDQEDQDTERTEAFECFLRCILDMPMGNFVYALLEAIRWRHASVDFLIRSRVDLACVTKNSDPESDKYPGPQSSLRSCALQELFSVACRYGSPEATLLFDYLYPAVDVNRADVFGITPLIAAILADDYSLCEWLLRKSANATVCLTYQYEITFDYGYKWTELLGLTWHIHPDLMCGDGFALAPQTKFSRDWNWSDCYPEIPNVWHRYSQTNFIGCPVIEALKRQNLRIFELLLEYGADPWHEHRACKSVFREAALHSESFFDEVVDLVRTNEVDFFDINRRERHSRKSLLHIAAESVFWNSVIKLISEGSTVNAMDMRGWTPLHEIASFPPTTGRIKTFKKLVEDLGADANMTDRHGDTPLDLLEVSIADSDVLAQNQDYIQTCHFLQQLKDPSYLPSIKRNDGTVSEGPQSNKNAFPPAPSPGMNFDWDDSSGELDLGSGFSRNANSETMSDIHSNGDKRSDANDRLDSSQSVSRNTSASQPHEERGLFPWLFLC